MSKIYFDWMMQRRGWVLGSYQGVAVSVMVTVMRAGLASAALTSGAVLGWILSSSHKRTSLRNNDEKQ